MSEAAVSQFFDKLQQDKALASEYNAAVAKAMLPAMVGFAGRHGFEFTAQDMSSYLKEKSQELDDKELEGVSAGGPVGSLRFLQNPWVLGAIVSTAIAVPLALDDDDDGA